MPFEAIVHAPALRIGARLNIAEVDQVEGTKPASLAIGDDVRLKLGCCSPGFATGQIIGYAAVPDHAVLAVGADTWTLRRGSGTDVSVPGLVSEAWYVAAKGDVPADIQTTEVQTTGVLASPTEHSAGHSPRRLRTEA